MTTQRFLRRLVEGFGNAPTPSSVPIKPAVNFTVMHSGVYENYGYGLKSADESAFSICPYCQFGHFVVTYGVAKQGGYATVLLDADGKPLFMGLFDQLAAAEHAASIAREAFYSPYCDGLEYLEKQLVFLGFKKVRTP